MKAKQLTWWILTTATFLGLLLPVMVKEGMFLDGVLYASVSRNLAIGVGSFWFPEFDKLGKAGLASFHEHPPLYFAMQSVFFRVFGDGYFVEKLFSLMAAVITGLGIILFWKRINKKRPEYLSYSWIPVLLWIIIPIVFYSYQHNLIEGTMSFFVLFFVEMSVGNMGLQGAFPLIKGKNGFP